MTVIKHCQNLFQEKSDCHWAFITDLFVLISAEIDCEQNILKENSWNMHAGGTKIQMIQTTMD